MRQAPKVGAVFGTEWDDALLSHLVDRRPLGEALIFRENRKRIVEFEKPGAPEGYLSLAVCLRPHRATVMQDAGLTFSGMTARGSINLYQSGERASVVAEGPWRIVVLFLKDELLGRLLEEAEIGLRAGTLPEFINPRFRADEVIYEATGRIIDANAVDDDFASFRTGIALQEIALRLVSAHSSAREACSRPNVTGLAKEQLTRVYEVLSDAEAKDLTLELLAKAAGCSAAHLVRSFKRSTGTSPFAWMTKQRMDRAKDLLRARESSIKDVAEKLGFAAAPQFSTAFKRTHGVSPSEYRRATTDIERTTDDPAASDATARTSKRHSNPSV